jgi:hypothetical protein
MKQRFTLLSLNCQSLLKKKNILQELLRTMCPIDVVTAQEARHGSQSEAPGIEDYKIRATDHQKASRKGGAITYVQSTHQSTWYTHKNLVHSQVKLGGWDVHILNIYLHSGD